MEIKNSMIKSGQENSPTDKNNDQVIDVKLVKHSKHICKRKNKKIVHFFQRHNKAAATTPAVSVLNLVSLKITGKKSC